MRSDKIGKNYCLNEIRLAGKKARLVEDVTEKNWNIEALDEDAKKIIRIQVDSLDWETEGQSTVRINFMESELDYLIIVLLNYKGEEFTSFVIPHHKLKKKGKGDTFKLIDEEKCVYYSSRPDQSKNSYQTIDITTLKHNDIRAKFDCYNSAFSTIKSLPHTA
jgi:hypothetical protein